MRNRSRLVLIGLWVVLGSPRATAQTRVGLDIAAGLGVPTADLAEDFGGGFLGNVGLFVFPSGWRIGFRADVGYGQFPEESGDAKFQPLTVLGNVLLDLVPSGALHPYLLGGAGLMAGGRSNNSYSRWALQGGAGLSYGAGNTRFFFEWRYVSSLEAISVESYTPLMLGVSFGFR